MQKQALVVQAHTVAGGNALADQIDM